MKKVYLNLLIVREINSVIQFLDNLNEICIYLPVFGADVFDGFISPGFNPQYYA